MKRIDQAFTAGMHADAELNSVHTTLYELIATINEDILSEEDWIVTDTVLEFFKTGQAKFLAAN